MGPRDLTTYGGLYANKKPVGDPTREQGADFANRNNADLAQLTRTGVRAWCVFLTSTASAPAAVSVVAGGSFAGTSSLLFPTVQKTGTGLYTVTYPVSFVDEVGTAENNVFGWAEASVGGAGVRGRAYTATVTNNVVTLEVTTSSDTLSDLSGAAVITLRAG